MALEKGHPDGEGEELEWDGDTTWVDGRCFA